MGSVESSEASSPIASARMWVASALSSWLSAAESNFATGDAGFRPQTGKNFDASCQQAAAYLACAILMAGPPPPPYGSVQRGAKNCRSSSYGGDSSLAARTSAAGVPDFLQRLCSRVLSAAVVVELVGVSEQEASLLRSTLLTGSKLTTRPPWLRLLQLLMVWRPWAGAASAGGIGAGTSSSAGEAASGAGEGPVPRASAALVAWQLQRLVMLWAAQATTPQAVHGEILLESADGRDSSSSGSSSGCAGATIVPAAALAAWVGDCALELQAVIAANAHSHHIVNPTRSRALHGLVRCVATMRRAGPLSPSSELLALHSSCWLQAACSAVLAPSARLPASFAQSSAAGACAALVSAAGGCTITTQDCAEYLLHVAARLAGCRSSAGQQDALSGQLPDAEALKQLPFVSKLEALRATAVRLTVECMADTGTTGGSHAAATAPPVPEGSDQQGRVSGLAAAGRSNGSSRGSPGLGYWPQQVLAQCQAACVLLQPAEAMLLLELASSGHDRLPLKPPDLASEAVVAVMHVLPAVFAVLSALLTLAERRPDDVKDALRSSTGAEVAQGLAQALERLVAAGSAQRQQGGLTELLLPPAGSVVPQQAPSHPQQLLAEQVAAASLQELGCLCALVLFRYVMVHRNCSLQKHTEGRSEAVRC